MSADDLDSLNDTLHALRTSRAVPFIAALVLLNCWITTRPVEEPGSTAEGMTVTITRTLTAALVIVGVAAPELATAQADPALLNGIYTGDGNTGQFRWTISSNCATEGCTAAVASSQGWRSIATLSDGRWNMTVSKPDGAFCDDGSVVPATVTFSIDAATLNGTVASDSNSSCAGGEIRQAPIKLVKVG